MRKKYVIEQLTDRTCSYTFTDTNEKGEKITFVLTKCIDSDLKNSLPKIWNKNGYIDRVLETYWDVETFVKDTEGNKFGGYNPQYKLQENENHTVINFDWMLEATEENKKKLIDEIYRLASESKGETATEKKCRMIREYAIENNIDIFKSIPDGWSKSNGYLTATIGTIWISNKKSFKNGNMKRAILLLD